ncbi:MAG: T9SS type A sorting domain-containing protein [bacterium]
MKTFLRLRNIFVIFLILGGTISAFGQNNTNFLLDSVCSTIKYSWQPGGATELYSNQNFYNAKNQLTLTRYWAGDNRITPIMYHYYYTNDKLESFEYKQLDCPFFKAMISYNEKGMTVDSITQTTFNCQPLQNGNKYSYEYNELDLKSKFTTYSWKDEKWLPSYRTSYVYDSMKNLIEEINERGDSNGLVFNLKYSYIYDQSNKLTERQEFEYVDQNWSKKRWINYLYQGSALNVRQYVNPQYPGTGVYRVDSLFYNNALLTQEIVYDVNNGEFTFSKKTQRTYDGNNLLIKLEFTEANLEGSGTTTTRYFYVPAGSSSIDGNISAFGMSPNPAYDQITISLNSIESSEIAIYNSLGEKVMSVGTGRDLSAQINISNLPKGMYFVRIGDNAAKFIKL